MKQNTNSVCVVRSKKAAPGHHVVVAGVPAALLMTAALAGCSNGRAAAAPADAAKPRP